MYLHTSYAVNSSYYKIKCYSHAIFFDVTFDKIDSIPFYGIYIYIFLLNVCQDLTVSCLVKVIRFFFFLIHSRQLSRMLLA